MHPLEIENLNPTLAAALGVRNKGISVWSFSALTAWGVLQPLQPLPEVGRVTQAEERSSPVSFFSE